MFAPSIASWNGRGFNNPDKVLCCKRLVDSFKLDMLCILENRIHVSALQDPYFSQTHAVFTPEDSCNNFGHSKSGRIWIKWNPNKIHFNPTLISDQIISGYVSLSNSLSINLSVIYAANNMLDRVALWEQIRQLAQSQVDPWILLGDFNCCRYSHEKAGGTLLNHNNLIELNNLIFDTKLLDIHSVGYKYTWFWIDVLDTFSATPMGNPMIDLCCKLKDLKAKIKTRDWSNSSALHMHLNLLHSKQAECLDRINSDPLNTNLNLTLKDINYAIADSTSMLTSWVSQRVKTKWIRQGEDDLKFLYAKIRARQAGNKAVFNMGSLHYSSREENIAAIIEHFKNQYNPQPPASLDTHIFPTGKCLTPVMAQSLTLNVTYAKIKTAVFSGSSSSAPDAICNALSISKASSSIIYLGIPISTKRNCVADFSPLMENISKKLNGWKAHLLSFAGRIQYLKFTIQNTIAYWIRGSILPKTIIKNIRKLSTRFLFFGDTSTNKKLSMISWDKVFRPKASGGLGIPSTPAMQFAYNCTAICRMYNSQTPLSAWLLARYSSPWKPITSAGSTFWRTISGISVGASCLWESLSHGDDVIPNTGSLLDGLLLGNRSISMVPSRANLVTEPWPTLCGIWWIPLSVYFRHALLHHSGVHDI
ncbi:hypothetical protein M5K25_023462 [Dendrobium thyrsiflorum]|uniref:Uncharacterized protein n=1 Tax=Dendrobium thyrsiflorum TaxID=117978 RepID=A0ABD0UEZ1_DENTH